MANASPRAEQLPQPHLHCLFVRTPAASLEPRLDLADANLVRVAGFHTHRQARRRAGRMLGESAAPEFADGQSVLALPEIAQRPPSLG